MLLAKLKRAIKKRLLRSAPKITSHPDAPSVVVAYNELGAFCLPRSSLHRPACRAVMNGDVWERETIAFMCANCIDGDIVHAGTFFGDFLPALSRAVGEGRTIWAFEPSAGSHRCAKTTIALNDLNNVELRHAALGATAGVLGFTTVDEHGRALGGGSHFDLSEGNVDVPQVRLDDVLTPDLDISILQLDVEGYEGEALAGARETIRRSRPIVILETVPDGFAERYNYVFECRVAENSVFRPA